MAPCLLIHVLVSTALELVYQYRQLAGKREFRGLTMDDIDVMNTIEWLFGHGLDCSAGLFAEREFARAPVNLVATLRSRGLEDQVLISDMGPGGLVCRRGPHVPPNETIEVVIDDKECALSYRFKAQVVWMSYEAGGDCTLGMRFIGQPLLLRFFAAPRRHTVHKAQAGEAGVAASAA
jgi:hypothetical protein